MQERWPCKKVKSLQTFLSAVKDLAETMTDSIGIFNEDEHVMELYSTLHGSQWKEAAIIDLMNQ